MISPRERVPTTYLPQKEKANALDLKEIVPLCVLYMYAYALKVFGRFIECIFNGKRK